MRGRKPKGSERRGKLCNMTNIRQRPDEVEDAWSPATGKATSSWGLAAPARSAP